MTDPPRPPLAGLAARYDIEREIGAGGMATVYLARDVKHKRSVALKVVRPELGGSEGVERFLREIELAARLQHPHILPVFDSGVIDEGTGSLPYFVMPYVEGETLRQRLQREGRLPVDVATTLAAEVADALTYAHAHGVIHRDIKPENILLSGGHAIVADFGVAKALESGAAAPAVGPPANLTRAGIAIGTPLYMSPEQATADDKIDGRSDQYSLACVLYEMLAGEPPFTGPTSQSVISRSLSAPRPLVSRLRADVTPELEQVVLRAMALNPAERFPDMSAFSAALAQSRAAPDRRSRRRWYAAGIAALIAAAAAGGWLATRTAAGRVVAPAAETLAVLPFNTSGQGVEFLGEGMVDLLATNLRGVGGITTVSPRAVLQEWENSRARGTGDLTQSLAVGRELGAGSVVLGSAVSAGGRVRLAADLYSIGGERLGRAQVDAAGDSVLDAVDRLSLALLRDVWRSKEPIPNLRLASLTTGSIEALRAFLEGERLYRRLAWDSALASYTSAVESDSTFALAHLRRAQVIGWTGGHGGQEAGRSAALASRFANRLPERDRRLLAGYRLFEQGKPAAIDSLQAFVAAYPADVEGWFLLGESMYHVAGFRPTPPETISAAFDSVIRRDSTLFPALIHPLELSLLYRDSIRFGKYFQHLQGMAPGGQSSALKTAAGIVWGPQPTDAAIRAALLDKSSWVIQAALSAYHRPNATSDTVLRVFEVGQRAAPPSGPYLARSLGVRAHALAGMGRWRDAEVVLDSLRALNREEALGIAAWAAALGLAPPSSASVLDSAVSFLQGPVADYARGLTYLFRGQIAEGRRQFARSLASHPRKPIPDEIRGLLIAADGIGLVLQGDSLRGIQRLREGLSTAATPGQDEDASFPRLHLALALAARPESRAEGIRWLRYGFNSSPLYKPLTFLELGRIYEAAGQPDSAAEAYGRFLRLWDRADPELRGRVAQARAALQELGAENPKERP